MSETVLNQYRSGVGIMLVNHQQKVFVGRRLDAPEAWQMPQGGIDAGEDIVEAARRELYEETGVHEVEVLHVTSQWLSYELPRSIVHKLWQGQYIGQRQKWVLMRFLGSDTQINLATDKPEFCEWRWEDIHNLAHLIVPFKRELYIEVVSILKPLLTRI